MTINLQWITILHQDESQRKERRERKKDEKETEKPLLFKRHKVVRFLISPNQKKVKIEVNKIMNPAFLGCVIKLMKNERKL